MAGVKIYELAKEFGMQSKELLEEVQKLGIPAKTPSSSLVDAYVDIVRMQLAPLIEQRQAEVAAERAAAEAEEAKQRAEEEARAKAEEEERRKQEEEARIKREEERAEREAERAKLEEEGKQRAAEEAAASKAPLPGVVEAAIAAVAAAGGSGASGGADSDVDKGSADKEAAGATAKAAADTKKPAQAKTVKADSGKEATAPKAKDAKEVAADEKPAEKKKATPAKAAKQNQRTSLEAAIAAEHERLEREKAVRKEAEEAQRYKEMAIQAEKLQKEKVLAEMRAEVEAAKTEGESRRSKKKKKKGKGSVEDELIKDAPADSDDPAIPHGGAAVTVTEGLTLGEFAEALDVPANDLIKTLFMLGTPLSVNEPISNELIELLADDLERSVSVQRPEDEMTWTFEEDKPEDLESRSPVVTVMGHVDHGKTSLLDAIRETGIVDTEAGGITQHIGASVVQKNGRKITFIDTPGHEAFTAMRARGANITDIVILVVAADDGVMPQTIEAISHAKAAGVPIVVAVNKIDKDGANPDRVRQMLTEYEVVPEDWGGSNIFVNISAKKRLGIDELLEMLLIQADMLELKSNPNTQAFGTVIEAKLDKGRGPVATVLVQRGTLSGGDALVAGTAFGRVRALMAPDGCKVKQAGPSEPVEILGLQEVPSAGDEFLVFEDERSARALAESRAMKIRLRQHESAHKHVSLDDLFSAIEAGEIKDLNLVVKADVQGSIEALRDALEKIDQSEVRINIVHSAVGGITETDIQLATVSNAIVIGFNVRPTPGAKSLAAEEKIDVRLYRVIYQAIEEINAARVGMLAPEFVEEDTARIEVRELFRVPKMGVIAGSYVLDGEINRDDKVRIVRDSTVIFEGTIGSLRRFKEDVKSVRAGYECGVGIEGFQDLKLEDIIEGYRIKEVARKA
ncbi:MAG: translation initiation factor IF-2 [Coriobacteriia bacterium]|nr:translation initiation factor IF-2 [Coriobacteriia bacterium]